MTTPLTTPVLSLQEITRRGSASERWTGAPIQDLNGPRKQAKPTKAKPFCACIYAITAHVRRSNLIPARPIGNIYYGTCSWTDRTLIESGGFYPADIRSPKARLRYYAQVFPIVEVDATYYALPSVNNCYRDYAVRNACQLAALLAQLRAESSATSNASCPGN